MSRKGGGMTTGGLAGQNADATARAYALRDARRSVAHLLECLGVDTKHEGLKETPDRVVRSLTEMLSGYQHDPAQFMAKTFPADGYKGIVLVADISVVSLCEHHLLPFVGWCHCAYIPDDRIIGLSKFARVVDAYSRRAQVQERLTHQIAECIDASLKPRALLVTIAAEHTCMSIRGVQKPGALTVTSEIRGLFSTEPSTKAEVFQLLRERERSK